jgi:aminoglycoside 6'-N-acetyltransferase
VVPAPVLQNDTLRLRPLDESDRDAVHALLVEPAGARWWSVHGDEPPEDELFAPNDTLTCWAIEESGALVGVLMADEELTPGYRSAGLDLSLTTDAQGRGLGPAALRLTIDWLASQRGHHRFTIDPRASNANAIRAYEKVGFQPVGVMRGYERDADGRLHDGLLMDLLVDSSSQVHPRR